MCVCIYEHFMLKPVQSDVMCARKKKIYICVPRSVIDLCRSDRIVVLVRG